MRFLRTWWMPLAGVVLAGLALAAASPKVLDRLEWRGRENVVNADFRDWTLRRLLSTIAGRTHWEIYMEPGAERTTSAHFDGLKTTEALSRLLGPLSFAVLPSTNGVVRLYVFQSGWQTATDLVTPPEEGLSEGRHSGKIPNELVVVLKPGARESIDDLARRLGARVVGRIDKLNAYRLEFDNAASATQALRELAANPDVAAVEPNIAIAPPPTPEPLSVAGGVGSGALNVKPRLDGNRVLVGLVDTAVQADGSGLKDFIVKSVPVTPDPATSTTTPTHGTGMAERILRAGAGVLNAKDGLAIGLVTSDIFGGAPTTSTFQIMQGMYAVAEQGVPIINLSVSGPTDSQVLRTAVAQLNQQGVVILAAPGNEPVTTPTYPAAYPGVIAVTAVNPNGTIASYANRGSFVDAGAPGSAIVGFDGQSYYVTGTSVSTANASGVAAALALTSGKLGADLDALVRQALALKVTPGGP